VGSVPARATVHGGMPRVLSAGHMSDHAPVPVMTPPPPPPPPDPTVRAIITNAQPSVQSGYSEP
jgi:hypothetical protein